MRPLWRHLLAAAVLAGCGAGAPPREEVAKSWVAAVDSEDWPAACELMVPSDPDAGCEDDLAVFAGREVRLLPPGGYSNGSETTDNKTRFAVTTEKDDTAYFEVVDRGGEPRVDVQVIAEAYDGP